jgi:hypothetical protein
MNVRNYAKRLILIIISACVRYMVAPGIFKISEFNAGL